MKKVRDWMNKNSAAVTICAVVLLLISLGFIIYSSAPPVGRQVVDVYYVDVSNQTLFLAKSSEIPPVAAPSGKMGVRAYLFACGNCPSGLAGKTLTDAAGANVFVGWLESYTKDAQQLLKNPQSPGPGQPPDPGNFDAWERGHLISDQGGDKWVQFNSPEGFSIQEKIHAKCGEGKYPSPCYPNKP